MKTSECSRCNRSPISTRIGAARVYCYRLDTMECLSCHREFARSCSREEDFRKTCPDCKKRDFKLIHSKDYFINCKNCNFSFEPLARNAKTCKRDIVTQCLSCKKDVKQKCDKAGIRTSCSNSCAAKLSAHGGSGSIRCAGCGEKKSTSSSICKNKIEHTCEYCKSETVLKCNAKNMQRSVKCPNEICKFIKLNHPNYKDPNKLLNLEKWVNEEERNYKEYFEHTGLETVPKFLQELIKGNKLYIRNCRKCQTEFNTNSTNKEYCNKIHFEKCKKCLKSYEVKIISADSGFCDITCAHLFNNNSSIHFEKISEYKDLNKWAAGFALRHNRKPGALDLITYFNVKRVPDELDRELFDIGNRSLLENIVKVFLEESSIDFLHNKFLLRKGKKRLQIDFFLTDYNLAIEVQDLWSHDRDSDTEPFSFGGFKKGPTYHKEKELIAISDGYEYLELWQEDILSGDFKKLLFKTISFKANSQIDNY